MTSSSRTGEITKGSVHLRKGGCKKCAEGERPRPWRERQAEERRELDGSSKTSYAHRNIARICQVWRVLHATVQCAIMGKPLKPPIFFDF